MDAVAFLQYHQSVAYGLLNVSADKQPVKA
jgi:hypothetical protein